MAIEVVPHSREFSSAVEAFNLRMRAGGSEWGFYVDSTPDWIPFKEGARTWREYHLAVEDQKVVRGAYALKPQEWLVNGEVHWLADWQGPFTEAEINTKYSPLMLRLARAAEKQYQLLFSLGHKPDDARTLQKMGWGLYGTPFCFQVIKPLRFLLKNKYLRTTKLRRFALDLFAYSFVGPFAMKTATALLRLSNSRKAQETHVEVVDSFGDWADEIWKANKSAYGTIAFRDKEAMNTLLPATGWPQGATRLKVSADGRPIGWSVVFVKQMVDDSRFGSLKVGLVADCFAHPDDALNVLRPTHEYLKSCDVDLICSNMSHPDWISGLRSLGYIILENRRLYAFSPKLKRLLDPLSESACGLHLTNLDGHGPHGFEAD